MNDISPEDARWLALLIDTEGSISVRRGREQKDRNSYRYAAWVSVGNASRRLIETARSIVGLGAVLTRSAKSHKGRVPIYYWQLTSRQAAGFLKSIYPYMIVRHRQARLAIYAQSLNKNRGSAPGDWARGTRRVPKHLERLRESLWRRCKECNNHGYPDLSDIPEPYELDIPEPTSRIQGGYPEFAKMQTALGSENLLTGGQIFRRFEISRRQAYRWADKWREENINADS